MFLRVVISWLSLKVEKIDSAWVGAWHGWVLLKVVKLNAILKISKKSLMEPRTVLVS